MSRSVREGPRLLQGARISIGPVKISGKGFESLSHPERAFIVGRYMKQHSEDGRSYKGGVGNIVGFLWPDYWSGKEFLGTKDSKMLYYWLKQLGFRNKRIGWAAGEVIWYLPEDLDDEFSKRLSKNERNRIEDMVKNITEQPVSYRCLKCGAGPWNTHEEIKAHLSEAHSNGDYVVEKVSCSECGKELPVTGMGNHMKYNHGTPFSRLSNKQKSLLKLVRENPGLHPYEYAEMLGVSSGAISTRARGIKKLGFLRSEGNVQNTRYYPVRYRGKKKVGGEVIQSAEWEPTETEQAVAEPLVTPVEQTQTPAPSATDISNSSIFELKDGSLLIITGDKKFIVSREAFEKLAIPV